MVRPAMAESATPDQLFIVGGVPRVNYSWNFPLGPEPGGKAQTVIKISLFTARPAEFQPVLLARHGSGCQPSREATTAEMAGE
jgi:hypothetical protein